MYAMVETRFDLQASKGIQSQTKKRLRSKRNTCKHANRRLRKINIKPIYPQRSLNNIRNLRKGVKRTSSAPFTCQLLNQKSNYKCLDPFRFGAVRVCSQYVEMIIAGAWPLAGWLAGWLSCWLAGWLSKFVDTVCVFSNTFWHCFEVFFNTLWPGRVSSW